MKHLWFARCSPSTWSIFRQRPVRLFKAGNLPKDKTVEYMKAHPQHVHSIGVQIGSEDVDGPIRIICLTCRNWWDNDYDPLGCTCEADVEVWVLVDPQMSDDEFNELLWMHGLVEELESHVNVRQPKSV